MFLKNMTTTKSNTFTQYKPGTLQKQKDILHNNTIKK